MILKIISKQNSPHVPSMTCKTQIKRKPCREYRCSATKDFLKIKLENRVFYHFRVPELGYIMRNSSNWNIKNFKLRSHNEMYWFKKIKWYDVYGAKWKVSKLYYQVLWEVIYAYFYNWDGSHYLVLIVYVLVDRKSVV